jgi:hypothetical protein
MGFMRTGTKFCVDVERKETSLAETKTDWLYLPGHPSCRDVQISSRFMILLPCHRGIDGKQEIIWSGPARQHQCVTTPLLWLVVGPPPAQDEKGAAAQHHSLLRCRPPRPARHIAESSTHGRGAGFHQSSVVGVASRAPEKFPSAARGSKKVAGSSWEKSRTKDRS